MRNDHLDPTRRRSRGRARTRVAAGLLAVTVVAALSACSSADSGSGSDGGDVELTMMNHSRGQEAALGELAAKYTKETGVKITVDTPGPADYLAKLQAAAQSRKMPDLFTAVAPSDMAPYYKAGWAVDLTDDMDSGWSDEFAPAAINLSQFKEGNSLGVEPGIYSAYWELATYGVLVNTKTSSIDPSAPPQTMSDFVAALKSEDGEFAMATSLAQNFLQGYASNYMTDAEIDATFRGAASWKTDAWRKTFQGLVDLSKAGVIANDSLPGGTDDNTQVEQSFFNANDVNTIFDGSFAIGVANTTAPDFKDYGSFGLPAADDATQSPRAQGIVGRGAVVNARGEHVEESLAFLHWLTEPAQQKVFVDEVGMIPSNADLLASNEVSAQATGFAQQIQTLQDVPNQPTANVVAAIKAGSQSLVLGEKTVDQVLDAVQTAQDQSS